MRTLQAIIHKELLGMSRDVHGLIVLFLMPMVFILVMSLALRDAFQPRISEKVRWAAWDADATDASAALIKSLSPPENAKALRSYGELSAALADGELQLAVAIHEGFSKALPDPERHDPIVTVYAEPGVAPALLAAFRADVFQAVITERVRTLLAEMDPTGATADIKIEPAADTRLVETTFRRDTRVAMTAVQQSVPAWLVFAMFFVVIPISTIFIAEKQHGTLPRLWSLQVSSLAVLLGKVVPYFLINLLQTGLMILVGRFVVPLLGGDALQIDVDFLALLVISSSVSLAAIGFALAVASYANTTQQATTVGGVANILFAAIGGVMVPKLVMPLGMQQASLVSPMGWALDGFVDVLVRGAHVTQLAGSVVPLLAFAAACGALAWVRLRPRRS